MLSLAWLFVQLVGWSLAFAYVLAALVVFVAVPPILGGYWLAGRRG